MGIDACVCKCIWSYMCKIINYAHTHNYNLDSDAIV